MCYNNNSTINLLLVCLREDGAVANNDEKRYTIGQMAKLCNVTTKQLRHYDENNILSPCYKDEETTYRYYSESQLEEILLIKELSESVFP